MNNINILCILTELQKIYREIKTKANNSTKSINSTNLMFSAIS